MEFRRWANGAGQNQLDLEWSLKLVHYLMNAKLVEGAKISCVPMQAKVTSEMHEFGSESRSTLLAGPVVAGQSNPLFVPSVMKTHIPLTDDPAQEEDLLQKYQERNENLSQQDRVIKFCTDAGFLTTVEVGQCFMTKDTEDFSQFTDSVARREYTLPRDENSSEPQVWI